MNRNKLSLFLVVAVLLFGVVLLSAFTALTASSAPSSGTQSQSQDTADPQISSSGSEVFSRQYSTQHAPCYGQLDGDRAKSVSPQSP